MAMPEVLMSLIKQDKDHQNLYVLDRGLSSSKAFWENCNNNASFVGRIKTNRKLDVLYSLMEDADGDLGKLELLDDIAVYLYNNLTVETEHKYRIIKAKSKVPRNTTRPQCKGKVKRGERSVLYH